MYKNICKLKKIKVHKVENKSPSKIHLLKAQPFNSLTFKCLVFAFNVYMTKMRLFYTCCFFSTQQYFMKIFHVYEYRLPQSF